MTDWRAITHWARELPRHRWRAPKGEPYGMVDHMWREHPWEMRLARIRMERRKLWWLLTVREPR